MSWVATAITVAAIGSGTAIYSGSQQKKATESAIQSQERLAAEQAGRATTEGTEIKAAGKKAAEGITAAGQPTSEELARQARYGAKAGTPGETLMTQAGPISQAVARRIQANVERPVGQYEAGSMMPAVREQVAKRVAAPGMDYDIGAMEKTIGEPVWASLKARGIAPKPGDTTGGGLGTTQYMKTVVPYLAQQKQAQVNKDIETGNLMAQYEEALSRGDTEAANQYATQARGLQQYYENVENVLSEAIRARLYESGVMAAGAEQQGVTAGGQTIAGGTAGAYAPLSSLYQTQMESGMAGQKAAGGAMGDTLSNALQTYLMSQGVPKTTTTTPGATTPTTTSSAYPQSATAQMPLALQKRLYQNQAYV